jgi:hypothetical protein
VPPCSFSGRLRRAFIGFILSFFAVSKLIYRGGFQFLNFFAGLADCGICVHILAKNGILWQERNVPSKCQEKGDSRPIIRLQVEQKRTAPAVKHRLSDVTTG